MHLSVWQLFWSHHHSGGWNEKEPNLIPQKALKFFLCKIANNFHYVFHLSVLIIYFYVMCNPFTAVAKMYIHSQTELVVCFCKHSQDGSTLPQGQKKPEAEAKLWEWHPRKNIFIPESVRIKWILEKQVCCSFCNQRQGKKYRNNWYF